MAWYKNASKVKGFLCDISGVLFDAGPGGGSAIKGSVEAIKRLKDAGVPIRFLTNETTCTREALVTQLRALGFEMETSQVITPIPAAVKVLKERNLRPFYVVHKDALPDFAGVDTSNPNCVVMGDAQEYFTYERLNEALGILMNLENPVLLALGKGRYYKSHGTLFLDVGAFMKAMEYATGIEAEVVGKPSKTMFLTAVKDLGLDPDDALMIGDDIVNDVGGAQAAGLRGLQVRTGKFRPSDETHPPVKPDGYVDNLAEAVDLYLKHR
ncbi:phospholysine phosphohistidine inorganic pyrophosphate phosphatase-like [Lineus longissimus]|uniref:phospholysine phosphohistidine inorganic pyrophosphate phosphatase-like n=1 Tax=Lineus longissimus TaxID=88925 RepID=UPI002B4E3BF7